MQSRRSQWIVVRGGGDLASGTIAMLWRAGYPVLVLETAQPSAIRRQVAFSEAVYEGKSQVEELRCCLVRSWAEAERSVQEGMIPLMVDPDCCSLSELQPYALVDAILAKKNLGTHIDMAPRVIALGPGFTVGVDAHRVIETKRGHRLGRVLRSGSAEADTGVPGVIAGYGWERVLRAPCSGFCYSQHRIGDLVQQGEAVAWVKTEAGQEQPVLAAFTGLLRGLLRNGFPVTKGFKVGDVDPRQEEYENCFLISDKARCIAGGVLQSVLELE